ncbi:MAG: PD40 domain-containing protein [Woeseia sp.]|nr:PD40 domain-containing protein [Woeseia sp.]
MKFLVVVVLACLMASCANQPEPVRYSAVAEPTGCLVEQITTAAFDEYQVQGVSSDGRLLSYTSDRGEDAVGNRLLEVNVLDLVTGAKTLLPEAINNSGNFSPDGEYLVVAAYDESGRTEILELHLDTFDITVIAPHEQWDWLPSYSADGRYIVFNSYRHNGESDIYVYERATKNLRRLTDYPGYDAHAQFSTDGERILFHRMMRERENDRYDFDLFVYDLRAGTEIRLTDGLYEESYGALAPDGEHIVFSWDGEEAPEKHNLYIRAPDGSYAALTDGDTKDWYAYWTRDGQYIYFNSDRAGPGNIFRIPMQGNFCMQ